MPTSIRLRLTLWNVAVLALMLVGLGVGARCTLQATRIASVDRGMGRGLMNFGHGTPPRMPDPSLLTRPLFPPSPGRFQPEVLDEQGHTLNPEALAVPYDHETYRLALQAQPGQHFFSTVRIHGDPVRILSTPLERGGQVVGVFQMAHSLVDIEQEVRRLTNVMFLLAAPALLIAGLGGAFLTSRALRPVREITQAAGRIEAENLSGRLSVAGRDELSELAVTFNSMLERLEQAFGERAAAYAEMEQAFTRLEAANARLERANEQQRRFTADASHELKTPLTVIEGTVSLSLSGRRTAEQYRQSLEKVGRSATFMTKIVQDLLLLARSDAGQLGLDRRAVSIGEVLAVARETVSHRESALMVLKDGDSSLSVHGDPNHLVRLFVNLLDNATRHTPPDGEIELSTVSDKTFVTIFVQDTGAGIAPEHLSHIFERFYRVDAARARRHGGTGLGLAICRSIVEAHGGTISITSAVGEGTRVEVRLPRASLPMQSPITPEKQIASPAGVA